MIGDNMNNKIYDIAIIGGGPAGISTAVYASRAGLDVALINDEPILGGTLLDTGSIENYPGWSSISGESLASNMESHLSDYDVTRILGTAKRIHTSELTDTIRITLEEDGSTIESKTVVIATGIRYKNLDITGEAEYTGKGVSNCATCDGFFFAGQDVAVIGGGDSAVESAIELSDIANSVTVVHRRDKFRAEQVLVDRLSKKANIKYIYDALLSEFKGDEQLNSLTFMDKEDGLIKEIDVKGAFVNVGIVPNTELLKSRQELMLDDEGFVEHNNLQTDIRGVYVVGDVRGDSNRQIVNAVADGSSVVKLVKEYLER